MGQHSPIIGWQNISETKEMACARILALDSVCKKIRQQAYEVSLGNYVAYYTLWQGEPKLIGLGWPDDSGTHHPDWPNDPQWYYVCINAIELEIGVTISAFLRNDGKVKVYPYCLTTPPAMKPIRTPKLTSGAMRIDGWRLRSARLRRRMTQGELAERIKPNLNYKSVGTIKELIARFERGEQIPYPNDLMVAAETILVDLRSATPEKVTMFNPPA